MTSVRIVVESFSNSFRWSYIWWIALSCGSSLVSLLSVSSSYFLWSWFYSWRKWWTAHRGSSWSSCGASWDRERCLQKIESDNFGVSDNNIRIEVCTSLFLKRGDCWRGDLLHYVPLITLQHHTTCSYIIGVSDAIYSQATLDGDIGLFLRKTNKSVPLSLSFRSVSLSICEGPLGWIP